MTKNTTTSYEKLALPDESSSRNISNAVSILSVNQPYVSKQAVRRQATMQRVLNNTSQ